MSKKVSASIKTSPNQKSAKMDLQITCKYNQYVPPNERMILINRINVSDFYDALTLLLSDQNYHNQYLKYKQTAKIGLQVSRGIRFDTFNHLI